MMPVNRVHAERHGPSMTKCSPAARISWNFWTYWLTSPPGSSTMWTSANAAVVMKADASATTTSACQRMLRPLTPFARPLSVHCYESSKSSQLRERFGGVVRIFGAQERVRSSCLRHVRFFRKSCAQVTEKMMAPPACADDAIIAPRVDQLNG